jgi:predicted amidohydrolase
MERVRRAILAVIPGVVSVLVAAAVLAQQVPAAGPPRKVVVGSLMYSMWGPYPGVAKRLEVLSSFIDAMSKTARQKYHVGLDIAALPETAVTGEVRGSAKDTALPLEGAVLDALGAAARRNKTYLVVPLYLAEDAAEIRLYNACVLLDRRGKVAGIYRKVHPVDSGKANQLEGGVLPGKDFPVFACDFGKVGVQICYDMYFDVGWESLAHKGAELVIWPTQSPQIIGAQCRAHRHHYYIVSSTWRNNISLVDPTGAVLAQQTKEPGLLVEQIDLSYVLLDWQPQLRNGAALAERYGKAVGYRYSKAEDGGIFWSNDPKIPVMEMVRELGLELPAHSLDRNRELQDRLRGGPPSGE